MPWYSMYNADSPQRNRFRQQSRASNPTSNVFSHTIHFTSPSYSVPHFRQQSHYASYPPPPSARRHYQHDFGHFRSDSGSNHGSSRTRNSSPSSSHSSSYGSSPFKSRSDGSSWYHHRRTVDSATERLLARADALTERLHRLLAKSADLHWRRMDHPVRPDIFNRMSQSNTQSTATGTSSTTARATANMASPSATDTASPSVKVDDITVSKTEPRPTTRTHVITIKLSNSYSNRGNHRTQQPQEPHRPQEPQKPQEPHRPQEPQKPQEPQTPQEPHEQQQSREYFYHHRRHQSPSSQHSSRSYRQSTTRKPPVVRIIPIQIEVESDDSGVVIDPERDIQVPDDDPRVPFVSSPSPSRRNMSPVIVDVPVTVSYVTEPTIESDLDFETDIESEPSIIPASGSTSSRRWALTLRYDSQ